MSSLASSMQGLDLPALTANAVISLYSREQLLENPHLIPVGSCVRLDETSVLVRLSEDSIQIVPIVAFGNVSTFVDNGDIGSVEVAFRNLIPSFEPNSPLPALPIDIMEQGELRTLDGHIKITCLSTNEGYCDLVVINFPPSFDKMNCHLVTYSKRHSRGMSHSGDRSVMKDRLKILCHTVDIDLESLSEGEVVVVYLYGYQQKRLCEFVGKGLDPQVTVSTASANYITSPNLSERDANGSCVPVCLILKSEGKVYLYTTKYPVCHAGLDTIENASEIPDGMVEDIQLQTAQAISTSQVPAAPAGESKTPVVEAISSAAAAPDYSGVPEFEILFHGDCHVEGKHVNGKVLPTFGCQGAFALAQRGCSEADYKPGQIRVVHFPSDQTVPPAFYTGVKLANRMIYICHLKPGEDERTRITPFLGASAFAICLIKKGDRLTLARPFIAGPWGSEDHNPGDDFSDAYQSILPRLDSSDLLKGIDDFTPKENPLVLYKGEWYPVESIVKILSSLSLMELSQFQNEVVNALKQLMFLKPGSFINKVKLEILERLDEIKKFPEITNEIYHLRLKKVEMISLGQMDSKKYHPVSTRLATLIGTRKKKIKEAEQEFFFLVDFVTKHFISYQGVSSMQQSKDRSTAAAQRRAKIKDNVASAISSSDNIVLISLTGKDGATLIVPIPDSAISTFIGLLRRLHSGSDSSGESKSGSNLPFEFDPRCLELDVVTVEALCEARGTPLADQGGLVLPFKPDVSAFSIPLYTAFSSLRHPSIDWSGSGKCGANGPISKYRIKLRGIFRNLAGRQGHSISPSANSLSIFIILMMLDVAEKYIRDISSGAIADLPDDLDALYHQLQNPEDNDDIMEKILEKTPKPIQIMRVLLGIILSTCASGNRGCCHIYKLVYADSLFPKKLNGLDWVIGIRIAKLMPFAGWDNTIAFDNLKKWVMGGFCWRIAEPLITEGCKAEKTSKKKTNEYLQSRNKELGLLFVFQRTFFLINRLIKDRDLSPESPFPAEYQEMVTRLRVYDQWIDDINPTGGTKILRALISRPMTWKSFQYALLVLRNITIKRSGAFSKIKQKLLNLINKEAPEYKKAKEKAELVAALVKKCGTIAEFATLFTELPQNFAQNFQKFVSGDSDGMKGDGEIHRIPWAVTPEKVANLKDLLIRAEEIAGRPLDFSTLSTPEVDHAPSEVVAAMQPHRLLQNGGDGESKSSAAPSPIDSLKAELVELCAGSQGPMFEFSQALTPTVAAQLVCQKINLSRDTLRFIFDSLEISHAEERLCEGILTALKVKDFDRVMNILRKSN